MTPYPKADISFDELPITRTHLRMKLTWGLPVTPTTTCQEIIAQHAAAFTHADTIADGYGNAIIRSQKERCPDVTSSFREESASVSMQATNGELLFTATVILKFEERVTMKDRVPARDYLKTVASRIIESM
jgi:hypothetical protein